MTGNPKTMVQTSKYIYVDDAERINSYLYKITLILDSYEEVNSWFMGFLISVLTWYNNLGY